MRICHECDPQPDSNHCFICGRYPSKALTPSAGADSRAVSGYAADGESATDLPSLRAKVAEWAMSLPEHPQWQWLRQEMLTVAGTQPHTDANSATRDGSER